MSTYTYILKGYLKNLGLAQNIVDKIAACFTEAVYLKDSYFCRIDNTCGKLGFVVNGLFYMYVDTDGGKTITKNFMRPQEFLLGGYNADGTGKVNIKALKDSIVLVAYYADILALYDKHPELASLGREGAEKRLQELYARLESINSLEAKERYRLFKEEFGECENEIPQYLIASYLGITPTQLSRIRKKLT